MASNYYSSVLPIIDLDSNIKPKEIIPISPTNISWYTINAVGSQTGVSQNSSIVFNIVPPSSDVVMSRMIRLRMQFQVNITGAVANTNYAANTPGNVFTTPYCGFASFPINSCISTLTLEVNNASTTIRSSQVLKDLMRYDDPEKLIFGTLSESPCQMDNVMDYSQITNFINSPFGAYADSIFSRNAFDINYVNNPALNGQNAVNGELQATFVEPLIIPPLIYTEDWFTHPGFANINQMSINIVIDQNALQRIFRSARNNIASWPAGQPVVSIIGTPQLIVGYYTVNPSMKIPPVLSYKYYQIVNYTTNNTSGQLPAVGSSFSINSNAIQLQNIPRAVMLSVTKTVKGPNDPDAYFPWGTQVAGTSTNMQNVLSITFNNQVGILSSASVHDLYLISKKNGLEMSYAQFSGRPMYFFNLFTGIAENNPGYPYFLNNAGNSAALQFNGSGGPILLKFGEDIPLDSEDYVGKQGYYTFQVNVTCWNNLSANVSNTINPASVPAGLTQNAQLNMIFIFDGYMQINNGTVTFNVGLPTGLLPTSFPKIQYPKAHHLMRGGGLQAGSLLGALGNIVKSIPIVGPLVGNLLFGPDEEEQRQAAQNAQSAFAQQAAQAVEPVQSTAVMPAARRSRRAGGVWKKYLR